MRYFCFTVIVMCVLLSLFSLMQGFDSTYNMSFTRLLSILSNIDLDFEHTLESIVSLESTLSMPVLPVVDSFMDVFEWVYSFITYILRICVSVIGSLVSFIRDILDFLVGILDVFYMLTHPDAVIS